MIRKKKEKKGEEDFFPSSLPSLFLLPSLPLGDWVGKMSRVLREVEVVADEIDAILTETSFARNSAGLQHSVPLHRFVRPAVASSSSSLLPLLRPSVAAALSSSGVFEWTFPTSSLVSTSATSAGGEGGDSVPTVLFTGAPSKEGRQSLLSDFDSLQSALLSLDAALDFCDAGLARQWRHSRRSSAGALLAVAHERNLRQLAQRTVLEHLRDPGANCFSDNVACYLVCRGFDAAGQYQCQLYAVEEYMCLVYSSTLIPFRQPLVLPEQ